jgi:hypothetical protein
MRRSLLAVLAAMLFVVMAPSVSADAERGAIKRFVRFPVTTYELSGIRSTISLNESDLPAMSEITVSGYWAGRSLLLIEFDDKEGFEEGYYVHFESVEMNDQQRWEDKMAQTGPLVCLRSGTSNSSRGGSAGRATKATKGFKSPC